MTDGFRSRLERVYAEHPLTADAIIDRVRRDAGTLEGIRAHHLAEAPRGGATDQNHVGGAAAVRAIASGVGLAPGWAVLDIGSGLGGTLRLLAEEFRCRCHGVELTTRRFLDAVRLTRLVGLDDLVTFTHGDFMGVDIPGGPFDLAIAQGAFMHMSDMTALLARVAAQLRPGGKLAIEDGVILKQPSTSKEKDALELLLQLWNGRFQARDDWPVLLDRAGFRVDRLDDLTAIAMNDFENLLSDTAAQRLGGVTSDERTGWELGLGLLRSGHVAVIRILATRRTQD